jgi:hypothetical protein
MTRTADPPIETRTRPLVAVICSVPLLEEGVRSALEFAEVRSFSDRGGGIAGLLSWLRPDAVVVDTDTAAAEAAAFALDHPVPLLHIAVLEQQLRLFVNGEWEYVASSEGASPESIRNVIAGTLFAREERAL